MTYLDVRPSNGDSLTRAAGKDFVEELDGFLPADEAAAIYNILKRVTIRSSSFYLGLSMLETPHAASLLAEYLPDTLAAFVVTYLRRLLRTAPDDIRRRGDGFELWTSRAELSKTGEIHLHIDCDEKLRTVMGAVRTPLLGSVLYLGPQSGLIGGETLFVVDDRLNDRFESYKFHDWAALAGQGDAVRVVEHRPGKLALFTGHMRHGQGPVTHHPEGEPRVVLLANLWDARIGDVPEGICALSSEEYRRKTRPQF
jgi:hypothetical protein